MFREPKHPKGKPVSGKKVDIRMVSTLMMAKICRDPGTPTFVIATADLTPLQATATDTLNNIPAEYHDFSDVFSGEKAGTLAPHRPYDLQINIEEGAKPIHGPIYSLSPPELVALQEFLKEHTRCHTCDSLDPMQVRTHHNGYIQVDRMGRDQEWTANRMEQFAPSDIIFDFQNMYISRRGDTVGPPVWKSTILHVFSKSKLSVLEAIAGRIMIMIVTAGDWLCHMSHQSRLRDTF